MDKNIELLKQDVFNEKNTFIKRWCTIKQLENLLNKEEFKDIQVVKDEFIEKYFSKLKE